MKLSIKYLPKLERPWLVKRVDGQYHQHAHMFTKKDAQKVRQLIDQQKYPYCKAYKTAMQRILTEEEMKHLKKKQRYYNPQKGRKQ